MIIAIASTRASKVAGVQRAFAKAASMLSGPPLEPPLEIVFTMHAVDSGVADTPTSIEELTNGALMRARTLFRRVGSGADLFVGVEGGLYSVGEKVFLQSWSCIFDGARHSFGSSGSIEIPAALAHAVLEKGADLGVVVDEFAEQHNVRNKQGTWGVLTNDLVTREDSFELATFTALMPFFNLVLYDRTLS